MGLADYPTNQFEQIVDQLGPCLGVEQGKRKTGNGLILMRFLAGEGLLVASRPM